MWSSYLVFSPGLLRHRRYSSQVDHRRSTTTWRRGPQSIEVRLCPATSPWHCEAGTPSHDFILIHWATQTQDYASGLAWKERSNCSLMSCKYRRFSFIKRSASSPLTAHVLHFLCTHQHEADLYRHTVSPLSWVTESEHPWGFVRPQRDPILWWQNESEPEPWGGLQRSQHKRARLPWRATCRCTVWTHRQLIGQDSSLY